MFESEYWHPAVTGDAVIIQRDDKEEFYPYILLVRRKNEPYKDKLALLGGFLDSENTSMKSCVRRELYEETSIELSERQFNLACVLSEKDRDPRERVVSVVYYAEITDDIDKFKPTAKDDASEADWYLLEYLDMDDIAFDHKKVIIETLHKLVEEYRTLKGYQPFGSVSYKRYSKIEHRYLKIMCELQG